MVLSGETPFVSKIVHLKDQKTPPNIDIAC